MRTIRWHAPVPAEYFTLTQEYLHEDWELYPEFGRHPGVDYGGRGMTDIPLFSVARGKVVYRDTVDSEWEAVLGNHVALYVPSADVSFLYCHLADESRSAGPVKSGDVLGVMGTTGKSTGIHLHLEGYRGRFDIAWRSFSSLEDIKQRTFDPDAFLRKRIRASPLLQFHGEH